MINFSTKCRDLAAGLTTALRTKGAALLAALVAASSLITVASPDAKAANPLSPVVAGRLATQRFGSIVEIHPCVGVSANVTLCRRIVWRWEALDKAGAPRVDRKNPDESLRRLSLVGKEILRGFRETASGVWTAGTVYNPDDGRTYGGSIRLKSEGFLELEVCALGIFCQRQPWRRPADIVDWAAR